MRILFGFISGFSLIAAAFLLPACNGDATVASVAPDQYAVQVDWPEAAGQPVQLVQVRYNRPLQKTRILLDSGTVDAEGMLLLAGNLPEAILAELVVGSQSLPVVLEPGKPYRIAASDDAVEGLVWKLPSGADRLRQLSADWQRQYMELAELGLAYERALAGNRGAALDSLRRLREEGATRYWQSIRDLLDSTSNPLLGYFAVESLDWPSNFDVIRTYSNKMIAQVPNSVYATDLQNRIVQWEAKLVTQQSGLNLVGRPAPELIGTSPDGRTIRLSDLRGQVVLVDFWASWCAPCRRENPNLVAQYRRYANRGFTVFSVSLDRDAEAWTKAMAADSLVWTHHVREADFGGPMSTAYGVTAIPAGFLVNAQGTIEAQNMELRGENLVRRLELILGP
ncbi:MAG: redoxin domain-containing protein [Bacteroidetes bacterium]|nr:redoxin domain-containing protein [Bacteroidota bacterium]